jgi:hypothetical protein
VWREKEDGGLLNKDGRASEGWTKGRFGFLFVTLFPYVDVGSFLIVANAKIKKTKILFDLGGLLW